MPIQTEQTISVTGVKVLFRTIKSINQSPWPWIDAEAARLMCPSTIKDIDLDTDGSIIYNCEGDNFCHIAMKKHGTNENFLFIDPSHKYFYQKCFNPKCASKKVLLHVIKDSMRDKSINNAMSEKIFENFYGREKQKEDPIIKWALSVVKNAFNLQLSAQHMKVESDGNSAMRAWLLSLEDPAVYTPETWTARTLELRTNSVDFVLNQLRKNCVDTELLSEHNPWVKDWKKEFEKLKTSGVDLPYEQDTLIAILSSYTGIAGILINLNDNEPNYFLPEVLFAGRPIKAIPVVLVKFGNKYESLYVPEHSHQRVSAMIANVRRERLLGRVSKL